MRQGVCAYVTFMFKPTIFFGKKLLNYICTPYPFAILAADQTKLYLENIATGYIWCKPYLQMFKPVC